MMSSLPVTSSCNRNQLTTELDPQIARLPAELRAAAGGDDPRARAAAAIRLFNATVIEQVAPYAVAVKPQIAYYELLGPAGIAAYEAAITCAQAAGLLVIGDIKRGDIGSTAAAYARAHLCTTDADGMTRPAAVAGKSRTASSHGASRNSRSPVTAASKSSTTSS